MADDIAKMRAALTDGASVSVTGAPAEFENAKAIQTSRTLPSPVSTPSLDDISNFLQNLPQQAQRFLTNPQAFTQAVTGQNPLPEQTGFVASATGLPQENPNSLFTPEGMAYNKGYETGEPYGIAAQAIPMLAPAVKPTAKMLAEIANEQVLNTGNIKLPMGLPDIPVYDYAVKPGGGNWKNSFGGEQKEAGNIGRHLEDSYKNTHAEWLRQLSPAEQRDYDRFFVDFHYNDPRASKMSAQDVFTELAKKLEPERQISSYSELKPTIEAYNNWVNGPYKNYIMKKLGTGLPNDSVLATIEKENFNPLTERYTESTAEQAQKDREQVIKDYMDTNKNADYIQAAFKRGSPIFNHIENENPFRINLNEPQNANIGKQTAKTNAGKQYEDMVDYHLRTYPKHGDYPLEIDQFPAMENLPYGTPIHDLYSHSFDSIGLSKLQDHVFKELMSGRLAKEKLLNLSAEAVTQKLIKDAKAKIIQENKSKEAYENWRQKNHDSLPAETSFVDDDNKPTGEKIIVLDKTIDPEVVKRNISQDTKELNHCVGACGMDNGKYKPMVEPHTGMENKTSSLHGPGYLGQINNGEKKLALLRGPKGESKATIEIDPIGDRNVKKYLDNFIDNKAFEFLPEEDIAEYVKSKYEDSREFAQGQLLRKHPEILDKFNEAYPGISSKLFKITQLKGYKNGKLKPEDATTVKNWLNSKYKKGELSDDVILDLENLPDIYDMRNRGLDDMIDKNPGVGGDNLFSAYGKLLGKKFEKDPLLEEYYLKGMLHHFDILKDIMPRFMTKEEILHYLR